MAHTRDGTSFAHGETDQYIASQGISVLTGQK